MGRWSSPARSSYRLGVANLSIVYADWCGPCKTISPVYEKLSTQYTKARAVTFTKVNVDNQQEISKKYGVTAMPTFMIFKNGSVVNTIKGADPRALTAAIESAAKSAVPSYLSNPGRTLGSAPASASAGPSGVRQASSWSFNAILNAIITFFGLYFISLFALDPSKAAQESMFNINSTDAPFRPMGTAHGGLAGRKVGDRARVGPQGDRNIAGVNDLGSNS